jgi:hypothetical protein
MAIVVANKMPFVLILNLVIKQVLKQYAAMFFSFLFYNVAWCNCPHEYLAKVGYELEMKFQMFKNLHYCAYITRTCYRNLVIFLFLKKWYFKFQSLVNEESFVYVKI